MQSKHLNHDIALAEESPDRWWAQSPQTLGLRIRTSRDESAMVIAKRPEKLERPKMNGLNQLVSVAEKRKKIQNDLISQGKQAASKVANLVNQALDFAGDGFGDGISVVKSNKGEWVLAMHEGKTFILHPQWGYNQARQFAILVSQGLLSKIAEQLEKIIVDENTAISQLFEDGPVPSPSAKPSVLPEEPDDESLIASLNSESAEFPVPKF